MNQAYDDHMANLYGWICLRPDPEEAVANLEDYALRDLFAWLDAKAITTGIPALIHGLMLCEAAERFLKNKKPGGEE